MSSQALSSEPGPRGAADGVSIPGDEGPGGAARRILRAADRAVLASGQRDADAWPYPSLVLTAADHDGSPILLLSTLADHTRNIARDGRVGLLFAGAHDDAANPLAGPRVSLLGRAERCDAPHLRDRYLNRHPAASLYMGFSDFAIYKVAAERAHVVAGLATGSARSVWVPAGDLLLDGVPPGFAGGEGELLGLLNGGHGELIQRLAPSGEAGDRWQVTGVDPEGCDLRRDGAVARLDFAARVQSVEEVPAALSRLEPDATNPHRRQGGV